MTLVIRTNTPTTDPSAKKLRRDALLNGDNGGVKFLVDMLHPYQTNILSEATAPVDGDTIRDIAEVADAEFDISPGRSVSRDNGGIDFSPFNAASAADFANVKIPAAFAGAVHQFGQKFLVGIYIKLPTLADFTSGSTTLPILCFTTAQNGYLGEVDLFHLGMVTQSGDKRIVLSRQTDGGATVVPRFVSIPASAFGTVVQIGAWRTATQVGLRVRGALDTAISTTAAIGANNSGDFSRKEGRLGIPVSFWANTADHLDASNFSLYRAFGEVPSVSGRDPVTVLDADYARNIARFG